ncbi:multicopper oxidase family protein [Cohnella sp. GCM10027633]|uniref:multicopper oxidase family protein n=1 Tax=unclassified Cohnella TaxID=2636738 RepID=UPI00362C6215
MFSILSRAELASAMFVLIFSWIASGKAAKLVYAGSAERLHRKARKQLVWAVYASFPAAVAIAAIALMPSTFDPMFWEDRAYVHLPLLLVPLAGVWVLSVPRLWRLWTSTGAKGAAPDPAVLRERAAHPLIVVPFQALALSAAALFYVYLFTPSVPVRPLSLLLPVAVLALAIYGTWLRNSRIGKTIGKEGDLVRHRRLRLLRALGLYGAAVGVAVVLIVVGMRSSKLPASLNMSEGPMDFGGGTALSHDPAKATSVAMLTGPRDGEPDRTFTVTARKTTATLASGEQVNAWTYGGSIPGTELRMRQGELVEVTLFNEDIDDGVTIHWHGLDVPNAEDGVAGATQDAVMPGESHVYRFVAEQAGTFWYHSHQVSQEAVERGLFGPLIVEPADADAGSGSGSTGEQDVVVLTHLWDGRMAVGANDGVERKRIAPGTPVRLRLINTDDWIRQRYTLVGTPFRVAAIDGTDLNGPQTIENTRVELTTGGRADLAFVMPDRPVYLAVGNGNKLGVLLSPDGQGDVPDVPKTAAFDPLDYGEPAATPFNADSDFDRDFEMVLDNKFGFYNGSFGSLYTINGEVFPNTPMFMVQEGDLIKTTIYNRGEVDHPMHLHGHHMLVLSRNGEASTGSPWWSDTLDVLPGDVYEVAFAADNPGLWMDHCHNLTHAAVGMSMHLMYEGVTSPYEIGTDTRNHPE